MFVVVSRGGAQDGVADIALVLVSTSLAAPTIDTCNAAAAGVCQNATLTGGGIFSLAVTGANATLTVHIAVLSTGSGAPVTLTVLTQSQKCSASNAVVIPRRAFCWICDLLIFALSDLTLSNRSCLFISYSCLATLCRERRGNSENFH